MLPLVMALAATVQQPRTIWLENLDLAKMQQDWGKPGKTVSVEQRTPLSVHRHIFAHGVGTHANSTIIIQLQKAARAFSADVGIDDETGDRGSVRFEVWVDGKKRADSGAMKAGNPARHLQCSLSGAMRMELVVDSAADGIDYDHADWGNAAITFVGSNSVMPRSTSTRLEPTMPISMRRSREPEFNGPRTIGCTPGSEFIFRVPLSGERPIHFTASRLPSGLHLDAAGILRGSVQKSGTYQVIIGASNRYASGRQVYQLVCGDHKLAMSPPMGWNSWNVWGTTVSAEKVKAAADAFVQLGLADYGYRFINIDDAWEGERNSRGDIQTNQKFGDMKRLADYVHSKGLLLGIYSSPGPKTCADYAGSFGHEQQDANTYAQWGIDYLKYDWCSYGSIAPANPSLAELQKPYLTMRHALDLCGRDIVFSLCQYGMGDVYNWGKTVGGNLWRTTGDITDTWSSMSSIAFAHSDKAHGAGPGGWNDPDMLVVGHLGWGDHPRPTRLTPNEQITHMTMWSLLAAPLILGCDLTTLDPWTKALITNREVIAVDQDSLGKPAVRVTSTEDGQEVWMRHLYDGTLAVGLMHRARKAQRVTVTWKQLKVAGPQPVRDLWMRKDVGVRSASLSVMVAAHGAKLFKIGVAPRD